jgi:hypothetical protein
MAVAPGWWRRSAWGRLAGSWRRGSKSGAKVGLEPSPRPRRSGLVSAPIHRARDAAPLAQCLLPALLLHGGLLTVGPLAVIGLRREVGFKWWALVCVLARLSARQRLR